MKFRLLFVSMLFILAPMSGCLSSEEDDSTKADSIVNGSNSLIKLTDESPGENCINGGVKIDTGIDLDSNQKLSDDEIDNTAYVCHGESGENGFCNPEDCCNPINCDNQTSPVDQLTGGGWHTCMLREDGAVMCWGNNFYGQIGAGYRNSSGSHNPIDVPMFGGHTVTSLSAGGFHNCAILDDGSVACWGFNENGTLGDGTYDNRFTPVPSTSFDAGVVAEQLSAGYHHTCGLLSNASVTCWGNNIYGQIGIGIGDTSSVGFSTPQEIPEFGAGSNASLVRSGGHSTCVVTSDGQLYCWGYKALKGITNANQNVISPAHIPHDTLVRDVSVGGFHTCSLLDNGSVMCWGRNDFGQRGLGYVQAPTDPFTPRHTIDFGDDRKALQVSAGTHHSCAILEDWDVVCWGNNTYGQLGSPVSDYESLPVSVNGFEGMAKPENLFLGNFHTCVLFEDKSIACWGRNVNGQVGDYTTDDSSEPIFLDLD